MNDIPAHLSAPWNGVLFFNENYAGELWISDGTANGTRTVRNAEAHWGSLSGMYFQPFPDGRVTFRRLEPNNSLGELWITDGTDGGTLPISSVVPDNREFRWKQNNDYVIQVNEEVFLVADVDDDSLWLTNTRTFQSELIRDDFYAVTWDYPVFTQMGDGRFLFTASDGIHGYELWITDGTSTGTRMVKDIDPFPLYGSARDGQSIPQHMARLGDGRVVFSARELTHGEELWVSDGTNSGTYLVKDFFEGSWNSQPSLLTPVESGKVVFIARSPRSVEKSVTVILVTDGTEEGTNVIWEPNGSLEAYFGAEFIRPFGDGRAIFQEYGLGLWITDGTASGTLQLHSEMRAYLWNAVELGDGRLLFRGRDSAHGDELWVTDGTQGGTHLVKDVVPGSNSSTNFHIVSLGDGRALFSHNTATSSVWITDGTDIGTLPLSNVFPHLPSGLSFHYERFAFFPGVTVPTQTWTFREIERGWPNKYSDHVLLFSHFALDAYNGGGPERASHIVRAPEGWQAILTTWDGTGARPVRPDGTQIDTYGMPMFNSIAPNMQATAYRELATGRVVVAYRGTDDAGSAAGFSLPAPLGELLNVSVAMGAGAASQLDFLRTAVDFYKAVVDLGHEPSNTSFAGHSLGGMLAGYLAAITGSQAMIFATGPHTEMVKSLHPLIDLPSGYGFLTTSPDFSKVTSLRIEDEALGYLLELAQTAAADGETLTDIISVLSKFGIIPPGFSLVNSTANVILEQINERWQDTANEARTVLTELSKGANDPGIVALHSMPLHALMLYAQSGLELSQYKDAPGFFPALLDGKAAMGVSRAFSDIRYFGDDFEQTEPGTAANRMLTDLMLAVHDGRENVVEPLLRDVDFYLTRLGSVGYGRFSEPIGSAFLDFDNRTVTDAVARHMVEMSARALLDTTKSYAEVTGLPVVGPTWRWVTMKTGVDTGPAGTPTQGIADLMQKIAHVTMIDAEDIPVPKNLIVRYVADHHAPAVSGTYANDLILGPVLYNPQSSNVLGNGTQIDGGNGNDVLVGSHRGDTLIGGSGRNFLIGGLGDDRYVASAGAGDRTVIVDTGGNDTLVAEGTIINNGSGNFRYSDKSLSLRVGTSGATIEIVRYYAMNMQTGVSGRIEQIIDGSGEVWRPANIFERIFGEIRHNVYEASSASRVMVTATRDAVDEVALGTLATLREKRVDILGASLEDFLRFTDVSLDPRHIKLRSGSLIVDVDTDLDGVVDSSVRFVGDYEGYGVELAQEGADTVLRLKADPATLFDVFGSARNDTLTGTDGANRIGGLEGNDIVYARGGNDSVEGGAGNDTLYGGVGADTMFGGPGDDIYFVDNPGDLVVEFNEAGTDAVWASATFSLSNHVEHLTLTGTVNISGTGNYLDNLITGNAGHNILDGGSGNDTVYGGDGNDTIHAGTGEDRLDGGAGLDLLVFDVSGFAPGAFVIETDLNTGTSGGRGLTAERDVLVSIENVEVIGGLHALITGNAESNALTGGSGSDTLIGAEGDDVLTGNAGNDFLQGGTGNDTLNIGEGDDTVWAGPGDDVVLAASGNNEVWSGLGNDSLTGGTGNDTLGAGGGDDLIDARAGGVNQLWAGAGRDTVYGADNGDQIGGAAGDDLIYAGSGADAIYLGAGNDQAYGGAGNDTIFAGPGFDRMWGGAGADRFEFYRSYGWNRVEDFSGGDGDTLALARGLWLGAGTLTAAQVVTRFGSVDAAGDAVLTFAAADTTIVIAGAGTLDGLADHILIL